jgi:uracil-DNA glycosylase family 4
VTVSAASAVDLAGLDAAVVTCAACPRLVTWRGEVAATRRRAFADEEYWGRPVPGFGDPAASVLLVGLAPAAHGGNRTGRIFTGDRSGDFLFAALHRVGVASSPLSTSRTDGQRLTGVRITAAARCAPPANRLTRAELATCSAWLDAELRLLAPTLRVVVALGAVAWDASVDAWRRVHPGGVAPRAARPRFGHGVVQRLPVGPASGLGSHDVTLLGCYHPSQQNTFTGRITEPMMDDVLRRALAEAAG